MKKGKEMMETLLESMGNVAQPAIIPTADSLENRRIKHLLLDGDALRWLYGKVTSARSVDEGIEVDIVWEEDWEKDEDKETTNWMLHGFGWNRDCVVEESWMLA